MLIKTRTPTQRTVSSPLAERLEDHRNILHRLTLSLDRAPCGGRLQVEHPALCDDVHVRVHPPAQARRGQTGGELRHGEGEVDLVESKMTREVGRPGLEKESVLDMREKTD